MRGGAASIAVSPYRGGLRERQFPGWSWAYVPNILGEPFLSPPGQSAERAAPGHRFVFLCAARLSAEKNHFLLIAAFTEAFAGDTQTRLHLAGDGPMRAQLSRLRAERRIARPVEFLGALSAAQMRETMASADA